MNMTERMEMATKVAKRVLFEMKVPEIDYTAEDVAQELWIEGSIIECEPKFVSYQAKLGTIDLIRKKYGRNSNRDGESVRIDVSTSTDSFYDGKGVDDVTLKGLEEEEMLEIIKKVLNKSKDLDVFCRYYSGESVIDIAKSLELPYNTTYQRLLEARKKLQKSPLVQELIKDLE
jgi:hypothetical protein